MSNKVKTIAILTAQPGKIEALTNLLHRMIPQCRAEPGNLAWDVWRDQADPAKFVLDEMYSNEAAVTAHRNTPHYKDYASKISDLADRTVLVLAPDQVV
jgi:quinol monooxygenase YgiN